MFLRRLKVTLLIVFVIPAWVWAAGSVEAADEPAQPSDVVKSPLEPDESLAHFRLPPGVKIELAAAEPEIIDPVAIRFDEDGRLWVVEMRDYPNGPGPGQKPLSRIKLLEDTDGDGRYE